MLSYIFVESQNIRNLFPYSLKSCSYWSGSHTSAFTVRPVVNITASIVHMANREYGSLLVEEDLETL